MCCCWCSGEDPDEEVVACPFCEVEGSEWELECSSCSKQVPFCIASGEEVDRSPPLAGVADSGGMSLQPGRSSLNDTAGNTRCGRATNWQLVYLGCTSTMIGCSFLLLPCMLHERMQDITHSLLQSLKAGICAGRRLAMRDWSQCPSCSLPARSTSLATYAAAGQPCPICGHHIATLDTGSITDPHAALSALTGFQSSSRRGKVKAAAANYSQMHLQILAS